MDEIFLFLWGHREQLISHSQFFFFFLLHCKTPKEISYLCHKFQHKKPQSYLHIPITYPSVKCEKLCLPRLNSHLFIEYLSIYHHQIKPPIIKCWLDSISFPLAQFRSFLPLLVEYYVKAEKELSVSSHFRDFLLKQILRYPLLIIELYWWIQNHEKENLKDPKDPKDPKEPKDPKDPKNQSLWIPFELQLSQEAKLSSQNHVQFVN